jgi:hypothetical protein
MKNFIRAGWIDHPTVEQVMKNQFWCGGHDVELFQ